MSFNVNCIYCQIVGKSEIISGKNAKGEEYRYQTLELKVPRQNPKENEKTAYDFIKIQALTKAVDYIEQSVPVFSWVHVDFVLRSFKSKDGRIFTNINAINVFLVKEHA